MHEVELARDAQRYSDLCTAADAEAEREFQQVHAPIASVTQAIRNMPSMTDAQLKQIIFVLSCKAHKCGCHEMAVAGLDDTGEIL